MSPTVSNCFIGFGGFLFQEKHKIAEEQRFLQDNDNHDHDYNDHDEDKDDDDIFKRSINARYKAQKIRYIFKECILINSHIFHIFATWWWF